MVTIGIFWLATSVYKKYFDNFIYTVHNLFPEYSKELFILSDGFKDINNQYIQGIKIHVIDVIDFPYPLVTANKFQMVKVYMEQYHIKYALYFDADTIIFDKDNSFWDDLYDKVYSGKFVMSYHPHYLYTPTREFGDPFIPDDRSSEAYVNPKYINDNRCYIITSFFFGRYEEVKRYANKIYMMVGSDLYRTRHIPEWPDEAYMNKIYVDENIVGHDNIIELDRYITINPYSFGYFPEYENDNDVWENNFTSINTIFINQKYDLELKNEKKNNYI